MDRIFRFNGIDIVRTWGRQFFGDAEAILIAICAISDSAQLSIAPDILFTLVTMAAAAVFTANIWYMRDMGGIIPGASYELLTTTIERLSEAALHPEHAPAKYARLMQSWMKKWEEQRREFYHIDEVHGDIDQNSQASIGTHPSHSILQLPSEAEDFLRLMDPDVQLDDSFWASFMENLSTPDSAASTT